MVDKTVLAKKLAAVRDAVARIADVLPATPDEFRADRTSREVVTLNLFLALQDCIGVATHWLADAGWDVPQSYGEVFTVLGERGVLELELALRLRAAAGLRNLIAHQYGTLDFDRIFVMATSQRGDLLAFCEQLAKMAATEDSRLR
jgi:uncharacterized protein YutE (UPF0331/DUF86 family)